MLLCFSGLWISSKVPMNQLMVQPGSIFYFLYIRDEPLIFGLLFCFQLVIWLILTGDYSLPGHLERAASAVEATLYDWKGVLWCSIAALIVTWTGSVFIYHNFPLCMDEYLPHFQAAIFACGKIYAGIAPAFRAFAAALTPLFVLHNHINNTWTSAYLPVYAALKVPFFLLHLESLTNPLLCALSIVLMSALCRKIWPREKSAPFLGIILLLSSTQFLITSMSFYSMPAHLFFNLLWLYTYTRDSKLGLACTPWIGAIALGIHLPFVHALFVTPFLLRILRDKKIARAIYFAIVYGVACVAWFLWMKSTRPSMTAGADFRIFQLPELYQTIVQLMNITLLFSWQSAALSFLFIWNARNWSNFTPLMRDLFWGCILTFVFYLFFPSNQGHGWGYRYIYGVLGNVVFLSVAGWYHLKDAAGVQRANQFVVVAVIFALLIQLPIRCLQVESFVRPFVHAMSFIESAPEEFILIDHTRIWYSQDLIRNDPFLRNKPKVLFAQGLSKEQKKNLSDMGSVRLIKPAELIKLGLQPLDAHP
jgi:hypothetical protein